MAARINFKNFSIEIMPLRWVIASLIIKNVPSFRRAASRGHIVHVSNEHPRWRFYVLNEDLKHHLATNSVPFAFLRIRFIPGVQQDSRGAIRLGETLRSVLIGGQHEIRIFVDGIAATGALNSHGINRVLHHEIGHLLRDDESFAEWFAEKYQNLHVAGVVL
jgi:hypothetical protein